MLLDVHSMPVVSVIHNTCSVAVTFSSNFELLSFTWSINISIKYERKENSIHVLSHFDLLTSFVLHLNKICTSPVGALYSCTDISPPWGNFCELNILDCYWSSRSSHVAAITGTKQEGISCVWKYLLPSEAKESVSDLEMYSNALIDAVVKINE
jgi:hypothetical protein